MATTANISPGESQEVDRKHNGQGYMGDKVCESIFLVSQPETVAPGKASGKSMAISQWKDLLANRYRRINVWYWLSSSTLGLVDEQPQAATHSATSSTEYATVRAGYSFNRTARLPPVLLKGLCISALLAVSWACIPPLLCSILDLLVEFEPSPLRSFAVACLKDHAGIQHNGSLPQGVAEGQNREALDIMHGPNSGEENSCQGLLNLHRDWRVRPLFGTFVFILKAATLCSLDWLRYAGLGPLLPKPTVVQRRLQRLGPILSSLFLMARLSHEPIQPPCEEWVTVRATRSTRNMLHTEAPASTGHGVLQPSPFDFVVVGGGAAGSTLAGLLSSLKRPSAEQGRDVGDELGKLREGTEPPQRRARILVLEAGGWPDLRSFSPLKIPARTYESQRGSMDWGLATTKQTQACKGLHGGMSFWPRGKGLGGSSWLNYMLYVRGDPHDFDSFSRCAKDERWKFRRVLKILKQIETVQFPADPEFRGAQGPITVNLQRAVDPTVLAFLRSAEGLGQQSGGDQATGSNFYAANPDYNSERYSGPSLFQFNTRNGRRRSPLEAFLFRAKMHDSEGLGVEVSPTVSVVFRARTIKILFEAVGTRGLCSQRPWLRSCRHRAQRHDTPPRRGRPRGQPLRATGVLVVDDITCTPEKWENEMCEVFEVPVDGELILSSGAIHTPQILLQSGVGDPIALEKLGLQGLVNLPGVGRNLQDHIFTPRLFLLKDTVPLDQFANGFPASANATISAEEQPESQSSLNRVDAYASLLHTGVAWDVSKETPGLHTKTGATGKQEGSASGIQLSIKTANEHRGNQFETIWKYLTKDAGLLASSGVEAQVVSEYFGDLRDEEDSTTPTPSSCPHGSPAPDIQLHFLNGLPDAAFMTSRLNLPNWFPFFIGSPESWGDAAEEMPGSVRITGNSQSYINPMRPPVIDPRYLSSDRDVAALVKGLLMVNTITASGPFAVLVKEELLPHCRPEVWRRLFTKNAFTGEAYVGLDHSDLGPNKAGCDGNCSRQSSDGCSGAECLLSTLEDNFARQYPELERIDPILPRFCALASAHESGLISPEEWARGFVRLFTLTLYHPVGTSKMGVPDPVFLKAHSRLYSHGLSEHAVHQRITTRMRLFGFQSRLAATARPAHGDRGIDRNFAARLPWSPTAVVDGALRLCGGLCVQNVRVADASVLPHLPSGNTHVPAVLVAHIAAEAIAEEWQKSS